MEMPETGGKKPFERGQPPGEASQPSPLPLAEDLPDEGSPRPSSAKRPDPAGMPQNVAAASGGDATASPYAVEQRLRLSNLARVRGDLPGAEREAKAALSIDPASGAAHEMLGDIYVLGGRPTEALESFRRAQSCGAGAGVEGKIGRILVSNRPDIQAISDQSLVRSQGGSLALVAALLLPGLGLALRGKVREAAISFAGWLITLALMIKLAPAQQVLQALSEHGGSPPPLGASLLVVFLGLVNLGFYGYSLIETARSPKPAGKDGLHR